MVALGLVACSSATDSAVSAEAANTEGRPLTVQAAPEWARCWFDVVGSDAQLSCSSPARANDPRTGRGWRVASPVAARRFHRASARSARAI